MVYNPYNPISGDPFKTDWSSKYISTPATTTTPQPTTQQPVSTWVKSTSTSSIGQVSEPKPEIIIESAGPSQMAREAPGYGVKPAAANITYGGVKFSATQDVLNKVIPQTDTSKDIIPLVQSMSYQKSSGLDTSFSEFAKDRYTKGFIDYGIRHPAIIDKDVLDKATAEDVVASADIALKEYQTQGVKGVARLPSEIERMGVPITGEVTVIPGSYTPSGTNKATIGNIDISNEGTISSVKIHLFEDDTDTISNVKKQLEGLGYSIVSSKVSSKGGYDISGSMAAPSGKYFETFSSKTPLEVDVTMKEPKSWVGITYEKSPKLYKEAEAKYESMSPIQKDIYRTATTIASSRGFQLLGTMGAKQLSHSPVGRYFGIKSDTSIKDILVGNIAERWALEEAGVPFWSPTLVAREVLGSPLGVVGISIITGTLLSGVAGTLGASAASKASVLGSFAASHPLAYAGMSSAIKGGMYGLGIVTLAKEGLDIYSSAKEGKTSTALGEILKAGTSIVAGSIAYKSGYEPYKPKPIVTKGYIGTLATGVEGTRAPFVMDNKGNLVYVGSDSGVLEPNIIATSKGISVTKMSTGEEVISISRMNSLARSGKIIVQDTSTGQLYSVGQIEVGKGSTMSFPGEWHKVGAGDTPDFIIIKTKNLNDIASLFTSEEFKPYTLQQLRDIYPHLNDEMLLKIQADMTKEGYSGLAGVIKDRYIGLSTDTGKVSEASVISHEAWHSILAKTPDQEAIIRNLQDTYQLKPTYLEIIPSKVVSTNIDISGITSNEQKGFFASLFKILSGGESDYGASVSKRLTGEGDVIQRYLVVGETGKGGKFVDIHDVAQVSKIPSEHIYGYGVGTISETPSTVGITPSNVEYSKFTLPLSESIAKSIGTNIGKIYPTPTYIPISTDVMLEGSIKIPKGGIPELQNVATGGEIEFKRPMIEVPTTIESGVIGKSIRPRLDVTPQIITSEEVIPTIGVTPTISPAEIQQEIQLKDLYYRPSLKMKLNVGLGESEQLLTSFKPSLSIPFSPAFISGGRKLDIGKGINVKQVKGKYEPSELKEGFITAYPDLISASVSQVRYGKATAPKFKVGEVESYRRQFFTKVPTVELMRGGKY